MMSTGTQYARGNGQKPQQGVLITDKERLNKAKAVLELGKDEIIKIAGKLVSAEELIRFTLNACVKNPKLFECFDTREGTSSIFLSVITSRIMDIPCDGVHGYLVPFNQTAWKERPAAVLCQFMPGYKGYVQLALRNPKVASINAAPVYEHDEFDFEYGTQKFLRHKPTNGESGPVKWAYAIWENENGRSDFRVLTLADIEKRKNASKTSDKGPWVDWYPEMCAKTALLALAKVAPLGHKVAVAAQIDDRIAINGQLSAKEVADYAAGELEFQQPASKGIEQQEREAPFEQMEQESREAIAAAKKSPPKQELRKQQTPLNRHLQAVNSAFDRETMNGFLRDAQEELSESDFAIVQEAANGRKF